jgi:transcription elongation factor GreA
MANKTASNVLYITSVGLRKLEDELNFLRNVRRREVANMLHEATMESGDLEENIVFMAAKTEQAFVEGRISEIEEKLSRVQLIEHASPTSSIQVGSSVVIKNEDGELETYKLVGIAEANPRKGTISYESPLGQALLDRYAGEEIGVSAPAGKLRFRILEVR